MAMSSSFAAVRSIEGVAQTGELEILFRSPSTEDFRHPVNVVQKIPAGMVDLLGSAFA